MAAGSGWRDDTRWGKSLPRIARSQATGKVNAVHDFITELQGYNTEALFLASGLNEIIGRDFQTLQSAVYRNARLEVAEGCGHDFAWVKPAETVEHIDLGMPVAAADLADLRGRVELPAPSGKLEAGGSLAAAG